jgi:PleD family two-component response regulator
LALFAPRHADEDALQEQVEQAWRAMCPLMSAGVAVSRPGESAESLMRRAEVAMYRHKAARKKGMGSSSLAPPIP